MNLLSTLNKRIALVTGAATVLAIGSISNALAVPPDKSYFGPLQVFGFYVGSCETFDILSDFTYEGHVIFHYDRDGNITRANYHQSFTYSTYYNSEFPDVRIEGGPGEGQNDLVVYNGDAPFDIVTGPIIKINVPGWGVIFHQVGRLVVDLNTGEFLVQTGPQDWLNGNVDALCAALTP